MQRISAAREAVVNCMLRVRSHGQAPATIEPRPRMMAQSRPVGQRDVLCKRGTRQAQAIEYRSKATTSGSFCWTKNRVATSWTPLAMLETVAAKAASRAADLNVLNLPSSAMLQIEVTNRTGMRHPALLGARSLGLDMQIPAPTRCAYPARAKGILIIEKNNSALHVIHLPTLAVSARATNGNLAWKRPPLGGPLGARASLTKCIERPPRPPRLRGMRGIGNL